MARMIISKSVAGFATALDQQVAITGSGSGQKSISVPKGKPGTLTTRTNGYAGVITLSAGHGLITGDVVDIYWLAGTQRHATLTVSGNSATFSGALGAVLPSTSTAVVVSKQVAFAVSIPITDDLMAIAMTLSYGNSKKPLQWGTLALTGSDGTIVKFLEPGVSEIRDLSDVDFPDYFHESLDTDGLLTVDNYTAATISNPSTESNATLQMAWITR